MKTMTSTKETIVDKSILFNRIMYGGFLLLAIYFLITKDVSSAMSNLGIGLIFDPFDQKITWQQRPRYQKLWLIVHLSIVLGLVAILIVDRFA
ncbi:MAG: hypothetical protein RI909_456 [Bacteroidota bacterium]